MNKKTIFFIVILFFALLFLFYPISEPSYSYSTVLNDRDGNLLGASIASDGQWRFPEPDSIPDKVVTCIQYFEDRHFYRHPGVNPLAVGRALWQNIKAGEIVSGASTITMQVARMMRKKDRTLWQKILEVGLALKLELKYSKDELMIKYLSMAPFGGNVVGLEAASWRYFNRPSHLLSWGEAASLAVLPNNPGAIFPGRSKDRYREKKNRLLKALLAHQIIDTLTYELSILEELPRHPVPIPHKASQLLSTLQKKYRGDIINSTIDPLWQIKCTDILERHHQQLMANGVENVAMIVIDLSSSEVLAYAGNTKDPRADGHSVDVIQSRRSPGSSLKPILYAHALSKGKILPNTLLKDIPTFFGGFSPKNFSRGYEGAVPASEALIKSLNIPFAYLLKDYTYEQFHFDLKTMGFSTLDQPPDHYGLSMVLGGAEVTLWDLSNAYLNMFQRLSGEKTGDALLFGNENRTKPLDLDKGAIWYTFKAMTQLARPYGEQNWESYASSQLISWKTGTSFGFRDAWAIGLNGSILVGVWVGNADGEGRAGLTGISAAAPILLEAIRLSSHDPNWLDKLKPLMESKHICSVSGFLANEFCPGVMMPVPEKAEKSGICMFHKNLRMDKSGTYAVNSSCYPLTEAIEKVSFVLPPSVGYYYQQSNPSYQGLPPLYPSCSNGTTNPIDITYPHEDSKVFIPVELNGEKGRVILEASHLDQNAILYWNIGDEFYGKTTHDHRLEVSLSTGIQQLKVTDHIGNERVRIFEILNKED